MPLWAWNLRTSLKSINIYRKLNIQNNLHINEQVCIQSSFKEASPRYERKAASFKWKAIDTFLPFHFSYWKECEHAFRNYLPAFEKILIPVSFLRKETWLEYEQNPLLWYAALSYKYFAIRVYIHFKKAFNKEVYWKDFKLVWFVVKRYIRNLSHTK